MKDRQEWIDDLIRRQDNIDPIRRIPNYAFFYGTLIKGTWHPNAVQRVGAAVFGLSSLALGGILLLQAISAIREGQPSELVLAIYSLVSLWLGWKIAKSAFVSPPQKSRRP
jgi:hypothetical protein